MSTLLSISHSLTRFILERIELTFQVATSKALKIYDLSYYHVNEDKNLVLNQAERFIKGGFFLAFAFLTPIFITIWGDFLDSRLIKIAEVKNYLRDEKRDIFNTFDTEDQNDQGFPVDPFDLMNRLKQAGSLDDATNPSDALDEALNAFDESEY